MNKPISITLLIYTFLRVTSLLGQSEWKAHFPNDSTYIGQLCRTAFDTSGNTNVIAWDQNQILLHRLESNSWYTDTIIPYLAGTPTGFIIDNTGTKWISTAGKGLYKIENGVTTNYQMSNSPLPGNDIYVMTAGISGDIWMGCFNLANSNQYNYMVKFNGTDWTIYDSTLTGIPNRNSSTIQNIEYNPLSEELYVSTWDSLGLFIFNSETWVNINHLNSQLPYCSILDLEVDNQGVLWLSAHQVFSWLPIGLVRYDGSISLNYDIPDNYGMYFEIDSNNNFWFGTTSTNSIMKFNGENWSLFEMPYEFGSFPHGGLENSVFDQNNSLWITGFNSHPFPQIIEFNENGIITSLSNLKNEAPELAIYPNPTSEFLFVPDVNGAFNIDIYTIEGKRMISSRNTPVDVRSLTSGTYVLRWTQDSTVFHSRFIKN